MPIGGGNILVNNVINNQKRDIKTEYIDIMNIKTMKSNINKLIALK